MCTRVNGFTQTIYRTFPHSVLVENRVLYSLGCQFENQAAPFESLSSIREKLGAPKLVVSGLLKICVEREEETKN